MRWFYPIIMTFSLLAIIFFFPSSQLVQVLSFFNGIYLYSISVNYENYIEKDDFNSTNLWNDVFKFKHFGEQLVFLFKNNSNYDNTFNCKTAASILKSIR